MLVLRDQEFMLCHPARDHQALLALGVLTEDSVR
jgi:hypothetical protein